MRHLTSFVTLLLLYLTTLPAAEGLDLPKLIKNGGLRVEDRSGRAILRYRDSEPLIPASTMKIATSYCALEMLGADFRFKTRFLKGRTSSGDRILYVEGSGDPFMVSEEFLQIAGRIAEGSRHIDRIIIDTSLFEEDLDIDGVSASTNPYDAKNAAFVGNFSSAMLTRDRSGRVFSAEPHTPLTPLAASAGVRLPPGVSERVNLGRDWKLGPLYGGELLAAFLKKYGVTGEMRVSLGEIPRDAIEIYQHTSSKNLGELVKGLLEYSTNFTANQIFLLLGVKEFGAPATITKAQRAIMNCLSARVGWHGVHIEEGSGLSRKTKVTAIQMNSLLKNFEPYKHLLHSQDGFLAKTGTLTGVNTLSGYFTTKKHGELRFTLLINSAVPALYKFTVAKAIRQELQ
jgi:D-alanyl-D-alanine carboxypeptidase/D-alanyl-D-alanine-endopeptidase (penicillin-binding protein 4)